MQYVNKISLLSLLLLSSCGYRTPSESRMKSHIGLELPDDFTVMKDEYIEAGKDYSIQYNVVLDDKSMKETTGRIRASKNFSRNTAEEKNNTWIPSSKGYYIFSAEEGISYEVIVDTTTNVIYYNEAG